MGMDVQDMQKTLPPILAALLIAHMPMIFTELGRTTDRDLASVELFSGEQANSRAWRLSGPAAANFDKRDDPKHDLSTSGGFKLALALVARIRAGGVCWAAPVCSSWAWVGRSHTKRTSIHPAGDLTNKTVRNANQMVEYTCLLLLVACMRGAIIYVEQPNSSLLPKYPVAKALFELLCVQHVPTF